MPRMFSARGECFGSLADRPPIPPVASENATYRAGQTMKTNAGLAPSGARRAAGVAMGIAAAALFMVSEPRNAAAEAAYPERTIKLLVGFQAGSPLDVVGRLLAENLQRTLGKPVIVENVPGAAGNIATERVAKSVPDGHTLLMAASAAIVINQSVYEKLPYDPVKDLAPITQVCTTPNIIAVHNDVPAKSLQEFIVLARSQPGNLSFGSAGVGTSQHLAGEMLKSLAAIDIRHVAYRSSAAAAQDMLGGHITMTIGNIGAILPLMREGKVRGLAITSLQRWPAAPDLPTVHESGFPGFESTIWFGLMAPAATPRGIIEKLHQATVKALATADLHRKLDTLGMATIGNTPAEFAAVIETDIPRWEKVARAIGLKKK
jgi:tripartite-type tricarboxylate transporter receptor subunit TctC